MRITTNGYKVPESADRGSVFFPALEYDLDRISAHHHDGNDSEQLTSKSLTRLVATLAHADWEDMTGGTYRQVVDLPAGMTLSNSALQFHIPSVAIIYPSIEIVSTTRFIVYVNDPTIDLQVYY